MRIASLARYQRAARSQRFSDLPLPQRLAAEAQYQRLCARWGSDLPQWRRAILAGRAKDLVVRPRDATWARTLRSGRKRAVATAQSAVVSGPDKLPGAATESAIAASERLPNMTPSANVACPVAEPVTKRAPYSSGLDVCGLTTSGNDGSDTAQRILRDIQHALDNSPRFSMAVPGKDLPQRWAWRLEVVPVP